MTSQQCQQLVCLINKELFNKTASLFTPTLLQGIPIADIYLVHSYCLRNQTCYIAIYWCATSHAQPKHVDFSQPYLCLTILMDVLYVLTDIGPITPAINGNG